MTTAQELSERLRKDAETDHARGCQGRCYECTCGWNDERDKMVLEAAEFLLDQAEKIALLKKALETAGAALLLAAPWCSGNLLLAKSWCSDARYHEPTVAATVEFALRIVRAALAPAPKEEG